MISITADRILIEETFDIPFKYPNVYKTRPIVSGLKELTLPVILSENTKAIDYGIWGVLPHEYEDSWKSYQFVSKLLYVDYKNMHSHPLLKSVVNNRRCVALITGYFVHHICEGKLFPYLVQRHDKKPFAVAGLYNTTADGFHTFALVRKPAISQFRHLNNVNAFIPIVIRKSQINDWLQKKTDPNFLEEASKAPTLEFTTFPLHREFVKLKVPEIEKLSPAFYNTIPDTL